MQPWYVGGVGHPRPSVRWGNLIHMPEDSGNTVGIRSEALDASKRSVWLRPFGFWSKSRSAKAMTSSESASTPGLVLWSLEWPVKNPKPS